MARSAVGLLILAIGTSWALTTSPLKAGQSSPQFATRADAVRLDVSVLDRNHSPIRGLTAADFTIREDGKERPITTFVEVDFPDPEPVSASWMGDIAADVARNEDSSDYRLIVLVLDDAMIPQSLPAFVNSAKAIGRTLIGRLGARDLAAVVYTRDNRKTQSFTQDRAKLLAAIEAFSGGPHEPTELSTVAEKARGIESVRVLNSVVEALETIQDRRKAVAFVSVGVPVEPLEVTARSRPGDPAFQIVADMRQLFRRAERANVNVFSIDPGGLDGMQSYLERRRGNSDSSETSRKYRDFLRTLSDYSGGRAFVNTNEFETGVAQILRETGHYYLIGYQPANPKADGRFRRVEARVNRTDATVRARKGYFAERPARDELPPPSTITALEGLLPKSDLPMVAAAAPFAGATTGTATVAIALGLPTPATATSSDKVAVLLNAYDVNGEERASRKLTATVALPAGNTAGTNYEVVTSIDLPPGRYELRLSAESTARATAGSVYVDVDVPNFWTTPLSTSGAVVGIEPKPPRAVEASVAGLIPLAPTVQRTFTAANKVTAFLRIHQGTNVPAPVMMTTRILDSANVTVFELPKSIGSDEFGATRSYDFTFAVPMNLLKPGEHVVIFEAQSGRHTTRRTVRFSVQ